MQGRSHLVLSDRHGRVRLESLLKSPPPVCEAWLVGADSAPVESAAALRVFPSADGFEDAVRARLAEAKVGLRLYLLGAEGFIWTLAALARGCGLNADEMQIERCGTLARRVWCVHCGAFNEDVRVNVVACGGCGRHLFVRDHFSRHHAAYMGFQVDAEAPGERPPVEELYP